jgi:hypothetical protein
MNVTVLLCDAAQEANGKLYILGAGWSNIVRPGPIAMALAVKIDVPWNETNVRHALRAQLLTEDGEPVIIDNNEVAAEGEFEVGRPPGHSPGTTLDVALALPFSLVLEKGGYRWELLIDKSKVAETPFRVLTQEK